MAEQLLDCRYAFANKRRLGSIPVLIDLGCNRPSPLSDQRLVLVCCGQLLPHVKAVFTWQAKSRLSACAWVLEVLARGGRNSSSNTVHMRVCAHWCHQEEYMVPRL